MPGYGHNEESEEMREVSGLFIGVGDGGGASISCCKIKGILIYI